MTNAARSSPPKSPTRLDPRSIDFDPDNPRQEDEDAIEGDSEFIRLKESVIKHGVLVPLVVRPSEDKSGRWVLVDGERRLRAAVDVNRRAVPVNVLSGDKAEALAKAFHIHTLRKEWGNTAQVRVIRRMKENAAEELRHDPSQLREYIQAQTGYGADRATTLIQVAEDYPEEVLEEVDRGQLAWSTLIQIRQSFIAQMRSRFPALLKDMGEKKIREILLDKARDKVLTDTRVLMDELVPLIAHRIPGREEKAYLETLLRRFLDRPGMAVEEIVGLFNERYPPARDDALQLADHSENLARQLAAALATMEPSEMRSLYPKRAQKLLTTLDELRRDLGKVIRKLRRRG